MFRSGFTAVVVLIGAGSAFAQQSCNDDIKRLSQRREAELVGINSLVKATKGGKLDPTVFCARSGGLLAAENALIAYLAKNETWCSVPPNVVEGLRGNHAKTLAFSGKACTVAAQIKKLKAQAAQQSAAGGGNGASAVQALPAGPL